MNSCGDRTVRVVSSTTTARVRFAESKTSSKADGIGITKTRMAPMITIGRTSPEPRSQKEATGFDVLGGIPSSPLDRFARRDPLAPDMTLIEFPIVPPGHRFRSTGSMGDTTESSPGVADLLAASPHSHQTLFRKARWSLPAFPPAKHEAENWLRSDVAHGQYLACLPMSRSKRSFTHAGRDILWKENSPEGAMHPALPSFPVRSRFLRDATCRNPAGTGRSGMEAVVVQAIGSVGRRRWPELIVSLLACLTFLGSLGSPELWGKREQRASAEALDTVENNRWLVAEIQGRPRLEKPPLPRWTTAALIKLSGRRDEAIVRLPALLRAWRPRAWFTRGPLDGRTRFGLAATMILCTTARFVWSFARQETTDRLACSQHWPYSRRGVDFMGQETAAKTPRLWQRTSHLVPASGPFSFTSRWHWDFCARDRSSCCLSA